MNTKIISQYQFVCTRLSSAHTPTHKLVVVWAFDKLVHTNRYCERHRVVLSIDVERHTGIQNYTLKWLGSDQIGKSFHTHQRRLHFMMLLWCQSVRSSVGSVPYPPSLGPGTHGVEIITLSARPQRLLLK